jgi:hypothetical protein
MISTHARDLAGLISQHVTHAEHAAYSVTDALR